MKSIFTFLVLIILFGCSSENSIEGKWRLTEIDFSEHLNTLDSETRKAFEQMIDKQSSMIDLTYYNFEEDSVLQVITPKKDGRGQIMQIEKWGISKNQDSLVFINSEKELFFVNLTKKDTLVLSSNSNPKRKLILVKSK